VDLGLEPRGVLTYQVNLPAASYATPGHRARFVADLLDRMQRLPHVSSAAAVFGLPLTDFSYGISGYELDGRRLEQEEQGRLSVQVRVVSPEFFTTVGIPMRRGRAFDAQDRDGAPPVIIVNEAAASLLWPGTDPLGHRYTIGTRLGQGGERVGGTVVGVVGDVRDRGPGRPGRPTLYVPHAQRPMDFLSMALRVAGDPESVAAPARRALAQLDPALPLFRVRTLEQLARNSVAQPRLYATLLALFAGTAVLLAVVGVYGVMSFNVARRTRDIGVRIALGATSASVLRLVLSEGARITAAGLGLGIVAAWATTRVLRSQLYGIAPTDPVTFLIAAVLLSAVAVIACYVPARRATRVDPLIAIKSE
jgi:putative ABC transport system permease protein